MKVQIYIVFLVSLFFSCEGDNTKPANKETAKLPIKAKFLNPLSYVADFQNLYFDELNELKLSLPDFIDSLEKSTPGLNLSCYFRDLNNGMTILYKANKKYSPASLMKVPVMMSVFKHVQDGDMDIKEKLVFEREKYNMINNIDGVKYQDGKSYTVQELVQFMIVQSDNIALVMLLDRIGLSQIESTERALGLEIGTANDQHDTIVTVRNFSNFFRSLYNSSYLNREYSEKALKLLSEAEFNAGLKASIPKNIKTAHKFGIRELVSDFAGSKYYEAVQLHHFAIVYHPHKPYLLGVMSSSDHGEKEMDMALRAISKKVYSTINKRVKEIEDSGLGSDLR